MSIQVAYLASCLVLTLVLFFHQINRSNYLQMLIYIFGVFVVFIIISSSEEREDYNFSKCFRLFSISVFTFLVSIMIMAGIKNQTCLIVILFFMAPAFILIFSVNFYNFLSDSQRHPQTRIPKPVSRESRHTQPVLPVIYSKVHSNQIKDQSDDLPPDYEDATSSLPTYEQVFLNALWT